VLSNPELETETGLLYVFDSPITVLLGCVHDDISEQYISPSTNDVLKTEIPSHRIVHRVADILKIVLSYTGLRTALKPGSPYPTKPHSYRRSCVGLDNAPKLG
jgi:hypothetical protein